MLTNNREHLSHSNLPEKEYIYARCLHLKEKKNTKNLNNREQKSTPCFELTKYNSSMKKGRNSLLLELLTELCLGVLLQPVLVEAGLADELLSAVLLSGRHSVCTYIATTSVRELVKLGSGSECKYRYRKALEIKRNGWNYQCFQLKFFYFEIYQISYHTNVFPCRLFSFSYLQLKKNKHHSSLMLRQEMQFIDYMSKMPYSIWLCLFFAHKKTIDLDRIRVQ